MGSPHHTYLHGLREDKYSMFANATVYTLKPYDIISTKFGTMTDHGRDFFEGGSKSPYAPFWDSNVTDHCCRAHNHSY